MSCAFYLESGYITIHGIKLEKEANEEAAGAANWEGSLFPFRILIKEDLSEGYLYFYNSDILIKEVNNEISGDYNRDIRDIAGKISVAISECIDDFRYVMGIQ